LLVSVSGGECDRPLNDNALPILIGRALLSGRVLSSGRALASGRT